MNYGTGGVNSVVGVKSRECEAGFTEATEKEPEKQPRRAREEPKKRPKRAREEPKKRPRRAREATENIPRSMAMICVQSEGNGSVLYDGKVQDVAISHLVNKDSVAVGDSVELKFHQRVWFAVVVNPEEPTGPHNKRRWKGGEFIQLTQICILV